MNTLFNIIDNTPVAVMLAIMVVVYYVAEPYFQRNNV